MQISKEELQTAMGYLGEQLGEDEVRPGSQVSDSREGPQGPSQVDLI